MSLLVTAKASPVMDAARTGPTILVIEDDPLIAQTLTTVLEGCGYSTLWAASGADGTELLSQAQPDLIILDLTLPDRDGLLLTPAFSSASSAPILICSARGAQADRVLGLKLGAADFVTKPFDVDELLARVEALLRRARRVVPPADPLPDIRVGDLVISPKRGSVTLAGQPARLTPTEFRLLMVLATEPETVFPRPLLAERVWGYYDASCDHTIGVHLARLRSKLRAIQPEAGYVVAVRKRGFRLARTAGSA